MRGSKKASKVIFAASELGRQRKKKKPRMEKEGEEEKPKKNATCRPREV